MICITLCATAAFAQLPYFNYGLKSGFNVSRLYFTDKSVPMKPAHCTGYLLGMWGRAGGYTFFLQPEAYLQRRNGKYYASIATQPDRTPGTAEEEYNDGSVKNNMTAFEMTMLLGTTVETGKVRTRLMAGPVIPSGCTMNL